jgi:hypothetical protein
VRYERFEHECVVLNALESPSRSETLEYYSRGGWQLVAVTVVPYGEGVRQVCEIAYFKRPFVRDGAS